MPLTATLEHGLKAFFRYVSSVNQTPLGATVLDPVYETAARTALRGIEPSAKLMEGDYSENLFFRYRGIAARVQYQIDSWDFTEARPELLTPRQRTLLHSVALGETSGFAVGAGFLRSFRNDPELGSFFGIWFTEELNHYWGYHRYLERMGEAWDATRKRDVTGVDFRDYSDDALEVAAANMYQELIAFLLYRSFARQVRDPFLGKMVAQFAKDEMRHYKFYQHVVAREIQRNPDFRVLVLKHFFKATTPVNQVSGGASAVVDHLSAAAFYFRKPEFDFLLEQNQFLFGASFESLFRFFYRRHLPPCATCDREVFECACEEYETAVPRVETRNAVHLS
jgi:hypothetical protein